MAQAEVSGMDEDKKASDGKNIDTMLDFNSLHYEFPPDLSVCTMKTHVLNYFQNNTYTYGGNSAYCIMNTGAFYVDGRDTYLSFSVQAATDNGTTATVGVRPGTALNFIRRFTITDRAGNEIERILHVNRLVNHLIVNQYSANYLNTFGRLWGLRNLEDDNPINLAAFVGSAVIPMRLFSGLFDYSQLLPPQLMSGLRIEIEWEDPNVALFTNNLPAQLTYTISNIRILAGCHQLSDSVARTLNERSATNGLDVNFRTWYATPIELPANTATVNVESRKAVSRCFGEIIGFFKSQPVPNENSMLTLNYQTASWQFRAGNLYFPLQPVTAGTVGDNLALLTTFLFQQRYFDKNRVPGFPNSVTTSDCVNANANTYDALALYVVDLERSETLDLSGIPLNNSRILQFNANLSTPLNTPTLAIQWMSYLKLVRVYMENCEIEE